MHCEELDRLLDAHSALTMEYFRQDGRTQEFYASDEEWVAACKRLAAIQEQLECVAAELADHRRQHGCGQIAHLPPEATQVANIGGRGGWPTQAPRTT
jgi:hypothetical protein